MKNNNCKYKNKCSSYPEKCYKCKHKNSNKKDYFEQETVSETQEFYNNFLSKLDKVKISDQDDDDEKHYCTRCGKQYNGIVGIYPGICLRCEFAIEYKKEPFNLNKEEQSYNSYCNHCYFD